MSAVVLTILGDATGVKRALGETVTDARRASAALSAQSRADAAVRKQQLSSEGAVAREQLRQQGADRRAASAERGRQERAAQAVREKGLAREAALAKAAAANATSLEKSKTAAAARESAARILATSRETTTKMLLSDREAARNEANERRKTDRADREGRRRTQLAEREARENRRRLDATEREDRQRLRDRAQRLGGTLGAVAGGARDFAAGMDGEIQSARQRRAPTERALGSALYQAGGSRRDVVEQLGNLTGYAAAHNMDSGELANALNQAQTEFSVLGNARTQAPQRNENLRNFLETARLARDTGNDVGEFTRLQGLFGDSRIDPTTQRQLLLYAAGAAQRGSIEVGSITREAMGSIRGRIGAAMSDARRAGADPQAAAASTFRQAMAELEVSRSTGESPRAAGNAILSLNTALRGDVVQQSLLGNIQNAGRHGTPEQRTRLAALQRQLYEPDPTRRGHQRLRAEFQDSLRLYEAFDAAGLSATDTMNLTRGGGRGNPMSVLSNQRRVLGNLLNPDADGTKGIGRIRDIMASGALSEADVARGRGVFANDAQSVLTGNQEAHDNALRDNNNRLVGVSDAINNWKIRHPWLNQGAESGGGAAGGVANALTGGVSTAVATKLLSRAPKAGVLGRASAFLGRAAPFAQRLLGGAAPFLGLAGGVAAGGVAGGLALGSYGSMEAARTGLGSDGRPVSTAERVGRGAAALGAGALFAPATLLSAIRDLPRLFGQELQQRPLVATVSPHDAALAGAGPSSASMPPTP